MKQLSVVIMGCGNRGSNYSRHMATMPEKYRVIGAADPDPARLEKMRKLHNVPVENCYATYQELLSQPKMADIALISVLDQMHYEAALKAGAKPKTAPKVVPLNSAPVKLTLNCGFVYGPSGEELEFFRIVAAE